MIFAKPPATGHALVLMLSFALSLIHPASAVPAGSQTDYPPPSPTGPILVECRKDADCAPGYSCCATSFSLICLKIPPGATC
ncbi:hypothetical protein FA15DRAFT_669910 [Coprinopsis marcescibilis]|uniref:WAP domain-containing protein n=1 Tax=Coprinopsis marcescibilis TaxID=230819 RepID=A0A5C3KU90_COPMA|nr:hypothetical protein FA15DRAFT_669910 [Coprinopsis marcescibilis]